MSIMEKIAYACEHEKTSSTPGMIKRLVDGGYKTRSKLYTKLLKTNPSEAKRLLSKTVHKADVISMRGARRGYGTAHSSWLGNAPQELKSTKFVKDMKSNSDAIRGTRNPYFNG